MDTKAIHCLEWAYQGTEKIILILVLFALLNYSPFFIRQAMPTLLRGDWADQALSEVLSERYGRAVTVKNAWLEGWSDIYFDSLQVRTANGEMLIESSKGSFRLKNFSFFKKMPIETQLQLNHVIFYHEYYKDSATFKPWNQVLRKPFEVDELVLGIVQNEDKTQVKILKSASKEVILDGGISVDSTGHWHDGLRVSFSPWMMLRALL